MKRKHRLKLRFQVAIIMIVFYIISVICIAGIMFRSNTESFVSAKKDMLERDIDMMYDDLMENDGLSWFLGFARQHPDEVVKEVTDNEYEAIHQIDASLDQFTTHEEYDAFLDSLTYEQQLYFAKSLYFRAKYMLENEFLELGYDSIGIMDIADLNDNNEAFVYYEALSSDYTVYGTDPLVMGDTAVVDNNYRDVMQKLLSDNNGAIEYDLNSDKYGYYITAFKPVVITDKVKAVMYINFEYTEFYNKLTNGILVIVLFMLAVMFIVCILMLIALDRVAISPLSVLRKSVRTYTEDKNVETVGNSIESIRSHYIAEEIDGLSSDFSFMVRELERYMENIRAVTAEKERIGAELDMAKRIQESALPNVFPAFPDRTEFDIYASMTPAKEVGGDFYDMFLTDNDHLAMIIADVSGKGVPAALFMMMSKILIHTYAMMGLSPGEVLRRTNDEICKNNDQDMFVTVWLGILEISTGKLTAANAGHEFPVIRQPDGAFELFKDKHGFVVGGMAGVKYREYELTLQRGGTLFVYTDGVPEATDVSNEMFGTDRLVEALNKEPGADPATLLNNVHDAVNAMVGEAPQFDDLTMLCVKYRGNMQGDDLS